MKSTPPSKTSPKKSPHPPGHLRSGPSAAHMAWASTAPQATATLSTEAGARSPVPPPPPLTASLTFTGTPEPPDTVTSHPAASAYNSHPSHSSHPQAPPPAAHAHPHAHDLELATLAAESALGEPEQEAYDLGLADGDQGFDDDTECPDEYLDTPHLREAYLNGHAIGLLNRRERQRQNQPHPYACCDCRTPFHLHHRPAGECADGELCAPCWEARGDTDAQEEKDDDAGW